MSDIAALSVKVRADTNDLSRQITGATQTAGQKAIGIAKRLAPAILAGYGVTKIIQGVKSVTASASDLQESVNATQVVYKEFGKTAPREVERLAAASAKTYGLSRKDFNGMAVQFSSFVNTVAGKGGDVVGTLDGLTTRAADFASVMNLDVADAARVFQSGLAGETEPLKKFGINLSAAAVEAYAVSEGIAKAGKEMTESQKIQARYGLLMEQTANTTGDFANTSESLANRQRILGATWEDLKAKIGSVFLPAAESAVGAVQGLVEKFDTLMTTVFDNKRVRTAITEVGEALGEAFGTLFGDFDVDGVKPKRVAQFFERLADSIPGVARSLKNDWLPAFGDFVSLAKDVGQGVGSGAWVLVESLGDALSSLPAEWRDDIVKIGALLVAVGKLKGVGNVFAGLGNLFGKNGILAGTKTMGVTAGVVNVNGAAGGGIAAGGKGGSTAAATAAGAGGGRLAATRAAIGAAATTAATAAATTAAAVAVGAALTAGSVGLIRAIDPQAESRSRQYAREETTRRLTQIIDIEVGKRSDDPLVNYIANNVREVGFQANTLPNVFQTIITQVETAKSHKELDGLTADRVVEIAAEAQTKVAEGLLDDATATRIAQLLAVGKVEAAAKLLNETADDRDALMIGRAAVEEAKNRLDRTVDPRDADMIAQAKNIALTENEFKRTARERKALMEATPHNVPPTENTLNNLARTRTAQIKVFATYTDSKGQVRQVGTNKPLPGFGGYQPRTDNIDQDVAEFLAGAKKKVEDLFDAPKIAAKVADGVASIAGGKMFRTRWAVTKPFAAHGYAVDLGTPEGTPVYAPFSGTLSNQTFFSNGQFYSYGRLASLAGAAGTVRVAHLSRFATSGRISRGQVMGWTGNVGKSSGPHAHVELLVGGRFVDPSRYLYDQGGWLPSGQVAVNLSGHDERVLSPEESRAYALGQGTGVTVNVIGTSEEVVERVVQRLRYEQQLAEV